MQEILRIFPSHLRDTIRDGFADWKDLQEIRVRIGQPLLLTTGKREQYIKNLTTYCITKEDMRQMVSTISKCSLYAFEEEIRKGYLTLEGGHRVGLAGQVVLNGEEIQTIRPITYLNIRVAHQVLGCGQQLADSLFVRHRPGNALLLSAPGAGKTTMLRDLIRILSEEKKVAVVDERSELAGCYQGVPQKDLGRRTDVLDGCPKALGMMMMLRSMSPDYLAVDEIGNQADFDSLEYVMHCGCGVVATMHCPSIEDLQRKECWKDGRLSKMFDYYVLLDAGEKQRSWTVYNRELKMIDSSRL